MWWCKENFALRSDLLLPIAAKVGKNARRNLRFLHFRARYTLYGIVIAYHTFTQDFLFRLVKRIVSAPAPLPLMPTPNNASGSTVAPHERQRRKTKVNSSYAAMTAVLRDRAAKGNKFTTQNSVQEVLKPEVSSCPFGYFWDSSQKYLSLRRAKYFNSLLTLKSDFTTLICTKSRRIEEYHAKGNFHQRRTGE